MPGLEAKPRRLLFVSYSHSDSKQALKFRGFLEAKLRGLRDQGKADWDFFFDREGIRAGEGWNDIVADKLAQADLLVYLISVSSLNSPVCRDMEVATAMRSRTTVMVPVVLSACPWVDQVVPGDDRRRTFRELDVLPKDSWARTLQVSAWRNADEAWTCVLKDLEPWLVSEPRLQGSTLPISGSADAPGVRAARHVPPLLPYLCDQKAIWENFDLALADWHRQPGRALVVIVKGTRLDEPKQFWNRLRERHVARLLKLDQSVLTDADFDWPLVQERRRHPDVVASIVRMKLSSALTEDGNPYEINTAERLAQQLARLAHPRPLVADFPNESPADLKMGLRALLTQLEACPEGADLSRLLIVVMAIDRPELFPLNLVRRWHLDEFRRCAVVEVGPLAEVTPEHADEWHREQRLEQDWQLQKQRVLDLFKHAGRMRAGQFAAAVRPILEYPG